MLCLPICLLMCLFSFSCLFVIFCICLFLIFCICLFLSHYLMFSVCLFKCFFCETFVSFTAIVI